MMSTHRLFDRLCVVVILIALLVTVLFMNGERLGITLVVDADAENHAGSDFFTKNDLNGDWDTTDATAISLEGESIHISGNGAYVLDGDVIISQTGKYVISGALQDGSIIVRAKKNSKVWLLFNGVEINCSDDACLRVDQADKVFLTLADGTENSLVSGADYSETALADGTNGVIYAHDDLTINGSGTLTITAAYRHGLVAKDDLVITGGTLSITAPQDGIHVNETFSFTEASLTITAGDDAIHADDQINILGGSLLITDCYEGLEAVIIQIFDGDLVIYSQDDALNANGYTGDFGMGGGMPWGNESSVSESAEVLSAEETYVLIAGGSLTIVNATGQDADGIDSNGCLYITGGDIHISLSGDGTNNAIDYGSENGGVAEISGGTILAGGGSQMVEGFAASSAQCSILYNISGGVEAGALITLTDAEGNTLLSGDMTCGFSSLILSCPEMQVGETYTLTIDGSTEEIALTEVSSTYGDAQSAFFGGNRNGGGRQFMGGGQGGFARMDFSGDDSEQPSPPDWNSEDGVMPSPPDWSNENSEEGSMPSPPDWSNESSEDGAMPSPPDWNQENDIGGMPFPADQSLAENAADVSAANETTSWLLIGVSLLALLLGLIIAALSKGKNLF
ncbi:MAG: carbohydrate-binding domain-containing protein [Clostridia bacterium]|nr:carbohydrate-binding domain-containing protein [Clostridia bacterium]